MGFPLRLVVLEKGAHSREWTLPGSELVVVAEQPPDRPADLALRAIRRIATLERGGKAATEAIAVLGGNDGEPARAARNMLARALLAHLLAAGEGTLVLTAPGASSCLRAELFGLLGELSAELGRSQVTVSLRFGASESHEDSGVRWTVPPAPAGAQAS